MADFVIANAGGETDTETNEPLFWSNDDGWGFLSTATVFSSTEAATLTPPIDGVWVELPNPAPRVFLVNTKDDGRSEALTEFFLTGTGLPEAEANAIRTAIANAEAQPGQEFPAPDDRNEASLTVTYVRKEAD